MSKYVFLAGLFDEEVTKGFMKLCLTIDSAIYNVLSWLYSIFITIARARIFTSETVKPFLDRIYLIVGIIALFFAAYTFMSLIINPENLTKGNSSPAKLIRNIIISVVAIVFVPTLFNFAYSIQGAIIDQNVIPKLFISNSGMLMDESENNLNEFAVTIFESSFYVKYPDYSESSNAVSCYDQAETDAIANNDISYFGTCLGGVYEEKTIQYNYIISGIIGIVLVYVFATYCFDVGLRAIKLGFLQIVSPLPTLLYMVPGQDKVFKSWLKETLKTFADIFIKIFIMVFGVYMIQLIKAWLDVNKDVMFINSSPAVINFAKIFIFLGVVMFIKKAPKLIEDLFGLKMDHSTFDLKKKFADSGITALVGGIGGMASGAYASVKGASARGGNKFAAGVSGVFHGARLGVKAGWNGSLEGIGAAHDYAQQNQLAWSHMNPKRGWLLNAAGVAGEMLRDNVGMNSYFDSQVAYKEIEFNRKTSALNRAKQSLSENSKDKMDNLEKTNKWEKHKNATAVGIERGSDVDKTVEEEVKKPGYLETTQALVVDNNGKLVPASISGSQIESLAKGFEKARNDHIIDDDTYRVLTNELDGALKRLKANFITNSMLMLKRDTYTEKEFDDQKQELMKSFKADYVESLKGSTEYNDLETKLLQATSDEEKTAIQKAKADLVKQWTDEAEVKFNQIITDRETYKTNLNVVNKINSYNDAMEYKGDSEIGIVKEGEQRDKKIKASDLGSEFMKSFKQLKISSSQIDYDRNEAYRKEVISFVDENNVLQNITLNQVKPEDTRISDSVKKLTEEMKDFKLALADDEQRAKAAQTQKKFNAKFRGKHNGQ